MRDRAVLTMSWSVFHSLGRQPGCAAWNALDLRKKSRVRCRLPVRRLTCHLDRGLETRGPGSINASLVGKRRYSVPIPTPRHARHRRHWHRALRVEHVTGGGRSACGSGPHPCGGVGTSGSASGLTSLRLITRQVPPASSRARMGIVSFEEAERARSVDGRAWRRSPRRLRPRDKAKRGCTPIRREGCMVHSRPRCCSSPRADRAAIVRMFAFIPLRRPLLGRDGGHDEARHRGERQPNSAWITWHDDLQMARGQR